LEATVRQASRSEPIQLSPPANPADGLRRASVTGKNTVSLCDGKFAFNHSRIHLHRRTADVAVLRGPPRRQVKTRRLITDETGVIQLDPSQVPIWRTMSVFETTPANLPSGSHTTSKFASLCAKSFAASTSGAFWSIVTSLAWAVGKIASTSIGFHPVVRQLVPPPFLFTLASATPGLALRAIIAWTQ
jgi:hypothetical protein